jgi:hypothetical protein
MGLTRQWYIEAWSVRDGMVFASYRPHGDRANAVRTVFIGVPGLQAIPLGRVSPALWATRLNFQDGLYADGEEIGFADLDHVRELVRRGYLAGGIGPGPGGAGGPGGAPPDQPTEPTPDLGALLDAELDNLSGSRVNIPASQGIGDPGERSHLFEMLVNPHEAEVVYAHLRVFAAATIAAWHNEIQALGGNKDEAAELAQWIQLLIGNARVWQSQNEFEAQLELFSGPRFPELAHYYFPFLYWGWATALGERPADDFLFHVPCVRRLSWDLRIRRLSDKLLLAVSTYHYFDQNPQLPELIPALLAALTVVSIAAGPRIFASEQAGRDRLEQAFAWLSAQMPQLALPPSAERALETFAWNELDRR